MSRSEPQPPPLPDESEAVPAPPPLPASRGEVPGSKPAPDTADNRVIDPVPDTPPRLPTIGRGAPAARSGSTAELFAVPDPIPFPGPSTGDPSTPAPTAPDRGDPPPPPAPFVREPEWFPVAAAPTAAPPTPAPPDPTPSVGSEHVQSLQPAPAPSFPSRPAPSFPPPPASFPREERQPAAMTAPQGAAGDERGRARNGSQSGIVTLLALLSALLFVATAGIGVWWTRQADQRAQTTAELKAEHAAFVDSQAAADAEVQERYQALDVKGRWAAVVAANEKYATTEKAFNAAYPTSQKTIPLSAGFALVSAVRQCLGPVIEYNRVAGQFSDAVRGDLGAQVDMTSPATNCNVIGWTTAP